MAPPTPTVVPLAREHLKDAAALLARRHSAVRSRHPCLPEAYSDPAGAASLIETLSEVPGAIGVAAVDNGDLVGYLCGAITDGQLRIAAAGNAVSGRSDVAGALYAAAAERALAAGARSHQVVVPDVGDELDAWYGLSFGREQAYGVRPVSPPPHAADDVAVRLATLDDLDAVLPIAALVAEIQNAAPVYAGVGDEFFAQLRDAHAEEIGNTASAYYVAERGGRIEGLAVTAAAESGLTVPHRTREVVFQVTRSARRGTGVGVQLFRRICVDAERDGYDWLCADWRTTNQLASRFWPRRGFEPVAYRLRRVLP